MRVLMQNGKWEVVTVVCSHCKAVLEIEPEDCQTDESLHKAKSFHVMCPCCKGKTEYSKTVDPKFWNGIIPLTDW